MGGQAQPKVKMGGRLAGIEKDGGGCLPNTWVLTLTSSKTGEWVFTRDNMVIIDINLCGVCFLRYTCN